MADACDFCRIAHGEDADARIVFHDVDVTAFFPLNPATKGHTLVIPNSHRADITELTVDESRKLGEAVQRVASAVYTSFAPDGLNVIQSNGEAATQTVEHVHFHVLPRWENDQMQLVWPSIAAKSDSEQDRTLSELKASLATNTLVEPNLEDRRQHLSFVQAVVTRMSQASASSKSWLLPIVTVTYGYAITKSSVPVALLGLLAVLVFGLLDANYLKQERAFRGLYDDIASGSKIPVFSLNPTLASSSNKDRNYWPDPRDIKSWSIMPVYLPLILAGVAILVWIHCK